MCGIAGWVSFDRDLRTEREALAAMTATLRLRGPDASGTWAGRHAAFGHHRLSVIDLDGGAQPMVDSGVALTYNGEIYNFAELRRELKDRGHTFTTASDTEVVLRGYLEWGHEVVERLNGMFAFAVWDNQTEQLVMARDRMGVKPFYYYPTRDGVLFGSEPKTILANPLARRAVDLDGIRELFCYTRTPGHGVWAGMYEVKPGTVLTLDRKGIRERTYWRLETTPHGDDVPTTVAAVRELLDDIVRRQLVADVPRGVLLSGGLDSSVITALAAAGLDEQVRTFSVDFVGQNDNYAQDELRTTPDTPFARAMAERAGTAHQEIVLDSLALADPDLRRTTVAAKDLPVGLGDMDISLYLLFRAIREHTTVALSGESADELFGGYLWFHDPRVQQADGFPWVVGAMSGDGPLPHLRRDLLAVLDPATYMGDRYSDAIAEVTRAPGESDHEWRMRKMSYVHLTRFVRVLLDRKDRMSMAVGLEVRVPFCDHRLVEYVYNAPWTTKTFDGREKSILRAAVADLLPLSVRERVKAQYPSTQDTQYLAALQQQGKELLVEPDNRAFELVNPDWLATVTSVAPEAIDRDMRRGLEQVLDIAAWLDIHRPELRLG